MSQHFLLTAAARTVSLKQILRMEEAEAWAMFCTIRWPETDGGLRPSRWCKLGDGHQHCASGRGQRGNGHFIISGHASHGLQRQVTVL